MTAIALTRITTLLEIAAEMLRQRDADKARILDACIARVREARMQHPDILATERDHHVPHRH